MKQALYGCFARARCDRLIWGLDRSRLRILMYHGVCEDHLAGEAWMPRYFVTRSAFERQMDYLRRNAVVLPLREAVGRLGENDLPTRSVSITFDDGYANNLYSAYPILGKHQLPATIFLSAAYVENGEFFPFDRLRLIQLGAGGGTSFGDGVGDLPEYLNNPLDVVLERSEEWWGRVKHRLEEAQQQTLRPLRVDELKQFDPELIHFGPHGYSHCILGNEVRARRDTEISLSISALRRWSAKPVKLFSYPNGRRADFDQGDKQLLRAQGIEAAVTAMLGANRDGCDPLELRRYPVGLYHDADAFVAELTGFRSFLRSFPTNFGA